MPRPAPDLETLFDVESQVENAWRHLLRLRHGIPTFTQRDAFDLPKSRVDVQCALGASAGTPQQDRLGRWWYSSWNYSLRFTVATRRGVNGAGSHRSWRARLRILASYASEAMGEDVLPYHSISGCIDAGTTPSVATDDDCDLSTLSFTGVVAVRAPESWPVR